MKRAWLVRALPLWAVWAAGCDATSGGQDGGGGDGGDGPPPAAACAWNVQAPELALTGGEVRGVLRGTSRNGSTTCTRQKGTGGPEALYRLRVTERALIELEVVSTIDTVLAIRRVCDDPLSELACNDGPLASNPSMPGTSPPPFPVPAPPPSFPSPPPMRVDAAPARRPDAGAPPDAARDGAAAADTAAALPQIVFPGGSRDAHLRAVLEPGNYYLLLDEAEPYGVGGEYLLRASMGPALAQSSCSSAYPLQDGTSLPTEELDLGTELAPACSGGERRPALYYAATIPSGQRLSARALATAGDRPWFPALQLLSACGQAMCLATDRSSPDGQQRQLRYVNNGPTDQRVVLAVGASTAVSGGTFRLDVGVGEMHDNGTCAAARPLSDGLVLRNQDLSEGQVSSDVSCKPGGGSSLFYSATLLPGQGLRINLVSAIGPARAPLFMVLRQGCDSGICLNSGGEQVDYTNVEPEARTVIVEVTSFQGAPLSPFELRVSMPLPPARLTVTPTSGLQTSEAGGQATFEVALASPPVHPVTFRIESSDPAEGTVSPAELRFEPATWQVPRTVTVTGVDDASRDGARAFEVRVGPAASDDPRYAGFTGPAVSVLNRDDEPGFHLVAPATLATTERGGTATFTVVLNRAPAAAVRLPISSSDVGEGTVAPAELVFEPAAWNQPRTVTVTGVDDEEEDGNQPFRILLGAAVSADADYAGIDPGDLDARNGDNEFERVAAQVVSGALFCPASMPANHRIAVGPDGVIHVAMPCMRPVGGPTADGGAAPDPMFPGSGPSAPRPPPPSLNSLFVVSSDDGGRTFGAPVDTGEIVSFETQLAAPAPGVVVVGTVGSGGITLRRSADAGATWEAPRVLVGAGGNLRLAGGGDRVVASADTPAGTVLWLSQDGGRTFKEMGPPAKQSVFGIVVDDPGSFWIGQFDGILMLRQTLDGGVTYETEFALPGTVPDAWAIGPQSLFAGSQQSELLVVARDRSGPRAVGGLFAGIMFPRTVVADASNNAVVLETQDGTIQARRLPAGAETFLPAKAVGASQATPAAVALSEDAIAVVLHGGSQVLVAVETWP
jgi:hypothetical protein